MKRDFTYIDDIINGVEIMLKHPPVKINKEPAYNLVNIGNGKPEFLVNFIKAIESSLQIKATKEYLPMQAGDVSQTWADTTDLNKLGYASKTSLNSGIEKFVKWYNEFYKLS
jgi:UDP-glucuronate 4-epimerase